MATQSQQKTKHFMALDGLRGVAALVVVAYHLRFAVSPDAQWHGYLAVDFFFLLSGFVIAHAYGARIASGLLSFGDFVLARTIRLYPLIVLGAVMGSAAYIFEGIEKHWLGLAARAAAALPFAALALPQPFLREPFLPNSPVWSLFFEILANLIYFVAIPRLSTRQVAFVTAALGVILAAAILYHGNAAFGWLWLTMPFGLIRVAFPFTAGVLLQRYHAMGRLEVPAAPPWLLALLLVTLLGVPVLARHIEEVAYTTAVLFIAFPLIVASASNLRPTPTWSHLSALSAEISFPIYLTHWPVLHFLGEVASFSRLPLLIRLPATMLICVAVSLAASRLCDIPVRRWLSSKGADRRFAISR